MNATLTIKGMNNTLIIAITAGLLGMIGWGLADFFAKMTIDKVGDMATLTWAHFFGLGLMVLLLLSKLGLGQQLVFPDTIGEQLPLLFFGALQAFVYFFVYRAFGKGQLAILNPIFSSYSGIVVVLSIAVFGEVIRLPQLFVVGLIFLGVLAISLEQDSLVLRKLKFAKLPGVADIITAAVLAALWTILWSQFVSGKDWLVYAAIMYFWMSVVIFCISKFQKIQLKVVDKSIWKYFFLIGLVEVAAYIGVSIGYGLTTHTSIVAVISGAFSVPTILLARVFLKDKLNQIQTLGAALIIAGIVLIVLV